MEDGEPAKKQRGPWCNNQENQNWDRRTRKRANNIQSIIPTKRPKGAFDIANISTVQDIFDGEISSDSEYSYDSQAS